MGRLASIGWDPLRPPESTGCLAVHRAFILRYSAFFGKLLEATPADKVGRQAAVNNNSGTAYRPPDSAVMDCAGGAKQKLCREMPRGISLCY